MTEQTNKYKMIIARGGKEELVEFDAVIGIEIKNNQCLLHMFDSPDIPETFWRNLPVAMAQNIEQGIASRRNCKSE